MAATAWTCRYAPQAAAGEVGDMVIDAAEAMAGGDMAMPESGDSLDTLLAGWTSGHDVDTPVPTDGEARDAVLVATASTIAPQMLARLQTGVAPQTRQVAQHLP
jgi:hypothetical protein